MLKFVRLLSVVMALYCGAAAAEQTVSLMANASPPYADQKLPEQGFALALVKHIFARTDYKPEITIENWSRAVEGARLGVYDGLAAAWYSEERNADLQFSEPYLSSKLIILKLRSNPRQYGSLKDLAGSRLGVRSDYAYGIDFDAIPDLTLVEENHLIQNLLRLLNGSVDFVIGDRRTIIMQLNEFLKDRMTEFSVVDIPLPEVQRHVAASRDMAGHEEMIVQFNKALEQTRKDGSLDAIISQWDERLGSFD
ncbi:MAG: transporter substrate-binding domain-containing protein [Pseudomonadales bacterium]|nr:transporter substrate-binding domain-containing protein [Halioglobus sp.]MCP5129218.1 transporter substrate-binding domain-containing protein [Pseudomonadales bacterium]